MGDLQDGVLPGPLGVTAGDEQVAVPERERPRRPAAAGTEEEPAWLPKRDQRDDGLVDSLGNLVPVPGDAVPPVPVEVEAGRVELDAVTLGECSAHLLEDGRQEGESTAGMPARGQ